MMCVFSICSVCIQFIILLLRLAKKHSTLSILLKELEWYGVCGISLQEAKLSLG